MRDALDAAWGDFPTDNIGYDWIRYTGSARPDPGWVNAVVAHSLVTFVQESTSQRSQQGFGAGVADREFAEARAREVHPGVKSIAVVVSDGDGADDWDASEYGAGWADAASIPFFPYGAQSICESFNRGAAGHPLCLGGTWVPETWGDGTFLSQVVGASPVGNTDLNHVWAAYYPTAPVPVPPEEEEVARPLYIGKKSDPAVGIWATDGVFKRHVLPSEWDFVQYVAPGTGWLPLPDDWWDSIPNAV